MPDLCPIGFICRPSLGAEPPVFHGYMYRLGYMSTLSRKRVFLIGGTVIGRKRVHLTVQPFIVVAKVSKEMSMNASSAQHRGIYLMPCCSVATL